MRDERTGCRAAQDRLQHRCFHLYQTLAIEIALDGTDDLRTSQRDALAFLIHDQIDIAAAETLFLILQSMELFRQRAQRLGQMRVHLRMYRQLPGIRAHERAFDADDIADIALLEELVSVFSDIILTHIDLQTAIEILNVHETGLALTALGHDTASHFDRHVFFIELFFRAFSVLSLDVSGTMCARIRMAKGIDAFFTQFFHLLSADLFLFSQLFCHFSLPFLHKKTLIRIGTREHHRGTTLLHETDRSVSSQ